MADVSAAITAMTAYRQTHVEWWAYMQGHDDCICDCGKQHPDPAIVGNGEHHQNCIDEYDNVLEVLAQAKG